MKNRKIGAVLVALCAAASAWVPLGVPESAFAAYRFSDFTGKPPLHILYYAQKDPTGVTPSQIRKVYGLPAAGATGTIAIIDAYDDASVEGDLAVFDKQFRLADCTVKNGCLEKHKMGTGLGSDSHWALETALDVEWAHAIAQGAKILLVEAKTPSGANLLAAVDYAVKRKDVVAVAMSWGGQEFSDEVSYDAHFINKHGVAFFASSGDNGAGVSWPAASPYVIGVGGTSLLFASDGTLSTESAWSGSGGGVSVYEQEPSYQKGYSIPKANGMRAVPDVAYNADPKSGFPIYKSTGTSKNGWYTVGGTSAGAPQWAAIQTFNRSISLKGLYTDKASTSTVKYFRDITSGSNGACTYYCDARKRYDYVTGLGSPQTVKF